MTKITADHLRAALDQYPEAVPGYADPWIDTDYAPGEVVIDGKIDLALLARLINEAAAE